MWTFEAVIVIVFFNIPVLYLSVFEILYQIFTCSKRGTQKKKSVLKQIYHGALLKLLEYSYVLLFVNVGTHMLYFTFYNGSNA